MRKPEIFQRIVMNRNIILIKIIAILVVFSTSVVILDAQKETRQDRSRYGGFIHLNLNNHTSDFTSFPGLATCCPQFDGGSGIGFSAGFLYEYPIIDNLFISARLGYNSWNAEVTGEEFKPNALYDYDNDTEIGGRFEHRLDTKIGVVGLEPMLNYRVFADLFIHGGVHLGLLSLQKDYDHVEEIIEPSAGTYENGSRTRLNSSGEIQDISSLHFSVMGGLSYEIPLNSDETWILAPEFFYRYGVTDLVTDVDWKASSIRLGFALKYSPKPARPITPEEEPELFGTVDASSVERDGTEGEIIKLKIEEYLSSNIKPLLSYVFFDKNSAELPDRYIKLTPSQTKNFSEDDLYEKDALQTYYHVLNIVGKRMQQYPDAKIAIDGCNSGKDENNNKELSRRRAEAVRDYLRDVWEIPSNRMVVDARNLPQQPSNINKQDGIEENRRAEITTTKWEILAPVMARDTFRVSTPPIVRYKTNVSSQAGIKSWNLVSTQDDKVLKNFEGAGNVPKKLDWHVDLKQDNVPQTSSRLNYRMNLVDRDDQVYQTPINSLPVELVTIQKKRREKVDDMYIDRFSLILFTFDEAELSYYNQQVANLIQETAQPSSVIRVSGHTDRMGDDSYNMKLSKERAQVVADALNAKKVEARGYGEQQFKYDNEIPEGRFYCRRVDVVVETPIEERK